MSAIHPGMRAERTDRSFPPVTILNPSNASHSTQLGRVQPAPKTGLRKPDQVQQYERIQPTKPYYATPRPYAIPAPPAPVRQRQLNYNSPYTQNYYSPTTPYTSQQAAAAAAAPPAPPKIPYISQPASQPTPIPFTRPAFGAPSQASTYASSEASWRALRELDEFFGTGRTRNQSNGNNTSNSTTGPESWQAQNKPAASATVPPRKPITPRQQGDQQSQQQQDQQPQQEQQSRQPQQQSHFQPLPLTAATSPPQIQHPAPRNRRANSSPAPPPVPPKPTPPTPSPPPVPIRSERRRTSTGTINTTTTSDEESIPRPLFSDRSASSLAATASSSSDFGCYGSERNPSDTSLVAPATAGAVAAAGWPRPSFEYLRPETAAQQHQSQFQQQSQLQRFQQPRRAPARPQRSYNGTSTPAAATAADRDERDDDDDEDERKTLFPMPSYYFTHNTPQQQQQQQPAPRDGLGGFRVFATSSLRSSERTPSTRSKPNNNKSNKQLKHVSSSTAETGYHQTHNEAYMSEKSDWLRSQHRGNKRLKIILFVSLALLVVLGIVGGAVGGVAACRASKDNNNNKSKNDSSSSSSSSDSTEDDSTGASSAGSAASRSFVQNAARAVPVVVWGDDSSEEGNGKVVYPTRRSDDSFAEPAIPAVIDGKVVYPTRRSDDSSAEPAIPAVVDGEIVYPTRRSDESSAEPAIPAVVDGKVVYPTLRPSEGDNALESLRERALEALMRDPGLAERVLSMERSSSSA